MSKQHYDLDLDARISESVLLDEDLFPSWLELSTPEPKKEHHDADYDKRPFLFPS